MRPHRLAHIAFLSAGLVSLRADPSVTPAASAATVPGADLCISIDYASLRVSPYWRRLLEIDTREDDNRGRRNGAEDGLTWDDMERITATMDLDRVDFSKIEAVVEFLVEMPLVVGIDLNQSLSAEQFHSAIKSELVSQVDAKARIVQKEENLLQVLTRDPDLKQDYPAYFGRAASGRQVLLGTNEKFVREAVRRTDAGRFEAMDPKLARLVADPSQIQIAVVLPEEIRAALARMVDEIDRKQAKAGGLQLGPVLAPLKGLKSVALRVHCKDEEAMVLGEAEFSTPELAAQAAMMANVLVAPVLAQRLTADRAKPANFKATARENRATLEGKLTQKQLEPKPKPRPDNTI